LVAALSLSPTGQEWGRGGDPPEMGQGRKSAGDGPGEEILRRWGKGRIAAGQQGCSEVEAWWLATGRRRQHLLFYFFYWADKWAPIQVSTNRIFLAGSALIGGSHLSDLVSIRIQLAISVN
jgi:hypothetical protein